MRKSLVAVVLTASALLLTSCAMPADDPNFDANAGGEDAAAASAQAAGQESLDAALLAPTSIGVDTPLSATPAKGKTIVSLTDGSTYEGVFESALSDAAGVLGWKVDSVTADPTDAAAVAKAFDDAVATKPDGIHISGEFVDGLTDSLPKAEAAGIPVVCTGCSGDPANGITDTSIDGTAQNTTWADALSTYVVSSQYENEDAGVQIFTVPGGGGAIEDFNTEFNASLLDLCRDCSATESTFDPTTTDLSDPSAVSEFVISEMSTSLGAWALLDTGALSEGVSDALASDPTLLSPVVLIGRGAAPSDIQTLQALGGSAPAASPAAEASASPEASADAAAVASASADGGTGDGADDGTGGRTLEQAQALQAWIAIPQPVMAWRVIDQFARIIGGDELATGALPSQLLTGANSADAVVDADGNYIGIADYREQFTSLWGVK